MVKLNRIYTRTGDDGTTGLVDGSRMAKHGAVCAARVCRSIRYVSAADMRHVP